jgi:hypothetical protein
LKKPEFMLLRDRAEQFAVNAHPERHKIIIGGIRKAVKRGAPVAR